MVAELPVDSGTFMAAMMLQVVVAGSLLVAMGTCIVYGFFEMRRREQEYEYTMGLNDLPTVTIATKTGTKYHRKNCQHLLTHVVAGNPGVRNYEPCQDCFPERYTYQEKKERHRWCYGVTAGFVLLTGFVLGSLATVCGMIVGPGTYTFKVKEPWQALGYNVDRNMVKEELALGDGQTSKDVRRGRRESQKRRERKGTYETDESELMTTWTSFSARPNTQQDFSAKRNFNVDTANVDDTAAYTTRNESDYKKERIANNENQECESLESGYAPRYLVKEVSQEPAVLREFFRKVESLFHDVVHGLGLELVKLIVCTGTPLGLVTWIVLFRFSHLFFVTVQKRRKLIGMSKVRSKRAKAGTRRNYRALLFMVLIYSNLQAAQGMEEALKQLAEVSQQTLQGIQTLAEEIRNTAATGTQREAGLAQAFQQTVATVQEQSSAAQQALTAAQQSAVTTMEEIGASLAKAVKERKPGEVELHKLIKAPEAFNPGTWQEEKSGFNEFKQRLRIWLGALDDRLVKVMDAVERNLKDDKAVPMSDLSSEGKEASRKLYSILCSYTKGRPYRVVKHTQDENGMEAYRMLMKEYQPLPL